MSGGGLYGPQVPARERELEGKANPWGGEGCTPENSGEMAGAEALRFPPLPPTQGPQLPPSSQLAEALEEEKFHEHGWNMRLYKIQTQVWDYDSIIKPGSSPLYCPLCKACCLGGPRVRSPYFTAISPPISFGVLPFPQSRLCCLDRTGFPQLQGQGLEVCSQSMKLLSHRNWCTNGHMIQFKSVRHMDAGEFWERAPLRSQDLPAELCSPTPGLKEAARVALGMLTAILWGQRGQR